MDVDAELRVLRGRVRYLEAEREVTEEAVARERERIIRLAEEVQATYWVGPDDSLVPRRPFALLLKVGPLEQETAAATQRRADG